jgi:hypothetical protein
MATLENFSGGPHDYRRALCEMDRPMLIAQQLTQHGAIHVLNELRRRGINAENVEALLESLHHNMRAIQEIATEKGVVLWVDYQS